MTLTERDLSLIWHPFTQAQTAEPPLPIVRGKGAYVYDESGRAYLDLISSWWVNLHGHAHPVIAKAIYDQASILEHVIFGGFTHEPAVKLCESLKALLPAPLSRFFFSDNGSTAVEVALKMAYQFWSNQGKTERTRFLSFEGAYHGDTFGAMAVGKGTSFFTAFQKLFFEVQTIPYPATWIDDLNVDEKETRALDALAAYLKKHGPETAAFILEPLIQGSSGMRLCRPQFLRTIIDLVREYDILIIFDEIMTGFGRTGTLFACEQVERVPDLLCLSKGLTGGFLPLSLTISQERIHQAFLGATFDKALAHGHSYTANPLGCAAALASLHLLTIPETHLKIQQIQHIHQERLKDLQGAFSNHRHLGTIAAVDVTSFDGYGTSRSLALKARFREEGLLLRPLGNVLYLLPPYCIEEDDLHRAYDSIQQIAD